MAFGASANEEMTLGVVITSASDPDLPNTVQSLRETAPAEMPIVVVDDASMRPVISDGRFTLVRLQKNVGIGPARTVGVLHSTSDVVLICDAHMRFTAGWYDHAMARIQGRPTTLHCGVCLGLDAGNMDTAKPRAVYQGGTLNILGKDRHDQKKTQVLEAIWNFKEVADDAEIPCCLGASYFIPRDFFLRISPLEHLRTFGEDEVMLSLKTWFSGGSVRLMKNVRIGHKFRGPKQAPPYRIRPDDRLFNKIFAILTLTASPLREVLIAALRRQQPAFSAAMRLIQSQWTTVELERQRNRKDFVLDLPSLARKFDLPVPA